MFSYHTAKSELSTGQLTHLLELIRYIHRNPVRVEMVDTLNKYPWFCHQGYLSAAKHCSWLYKDFILSMLAAHPGEQKKAYLKFMEQEDSDELFELFDRKKWPTMHGGDDFVSWVKKTFFQEKQNRQSPESLQLAPDKTQIIREVCRMYEVEEKKLLTVRCGYSNEPRDIAIYLCRLLRNNTLKELGKTFGMTGYSSAGSAVDRVRKKLSEDTNLEQRVEQIKDCLFKI